MADIPISKQQRNAIAELTERTYGLRSLTGPAGSGKTTVIKSLVGEDTVVVAPTNAAAKVLRSKGIAAATIHKIFYIPEQYESASGRKLTRFVAADKWEGDLPPGKLDHAQRVIVDEASMVSSWVLRDLLRMCDDLILVGDGAQLPPVGDKWHPRGQFNTLKHTAELTEVHRQTEGNPALAMATKLRTGALYPLDAEVVRPFLPTKKLSESIAAGKSWRVITFTNLERHKKNARVRSFMGYEGKLEPQPGELLISMAAYSDTIVNGTFMRVVSAKFPDLSDNMPTMDKVYGTVTVRIEDGDSEEQTLRISMGTWLEDFTDTFAAMRREPLRLESADEGAPALAQLNFGYSVTCHKAQGSEFDHVFVVDERRGIYGMSAAQAENAAPDVDPLSGEEAARRWAYTAFTRTRSGLTVIAKEKAK